MPTINLQNTPSAGPLTEADLDALARSKREPGPQVSKASRRAHRFADLFVITGSVIAVIAFLAGPVLALIGA